MESNSKESKNQLSKNSNEQDVLDCFRYLGKMGVYKKSLRPTKSVKPLSLAPRKFKSMSRIQKTSHLRVNDSELT